MRRVRVRLAGVRHAGVWRAPQVDETLLARLEVEARRMHMQTDMHVHVKTYTPCLESW